MMRLSAAGLAHLKRLEGSVVRDGRHVPYDDATGRPLAAAAPPRGNATIGYGHMIPRGHAVPWGGWSDAEAEHVLRADVAAAEAAVNELVKVELTQGRFDSLTSFAFNVGRKNFARTKLLALVNAGDMAAAAARFAHHTNGYDHAGNLIKIPALARRRAAERALFEGKS